MNRATLGLGAFLVVACGGIAAGILAWRRHVEVPNHALVAAYARYSTCYFGGPIQGPSPCQLLSTTAWSLPDDVAWPERCEPYAAEVLRLGRADGTKSIDALVHPATRRAARECYSLHDRAMTLDAKMRAYGAERVADGVPIPGPRLPPFTSSDQDSVDVEGYSVTAFPAEHEGTAWGVNAAHYDSDHSRSVDAWFVYKGDGHALKTAPSPRAPRGASPFLARLPDGADAFLAATAGATSTVRTREGFVSATLPRIGGAEAIVFLDTRGRALRAIDLPGEHVHALFPQGMLVSTEANRWNGRSFATGALGVLHPFGYGDAAQLTLVGSCGDLDGGGALLDGVQGTRIVVTDGPRFASYNAEGRAGEGAHLVGCRAGAVTIVTRAPRRVLECSMTGCAVRAELEPNDTNEVSSFARIAESLVELRHGWRIRLRVGKAEALKSQPFRVLGDAGGDGGGLRATLVPDPDRGKAMVFLHYGPRTTPANKLAAVEIEENGDITRVPLEPLPPSPKSNARGSSPR